MGLRKYENVRRRVPAWAWQGLQSAYRAAYPGWARAKCLWADCSDRFAGPGNGLAAPPARLRYRVCGSPSRSLFTNAGKAAAEGLVENFESLGFPLSGGSRVLDFGCGSGRTLIHLIHQHSKADFHGVDIDEESVAWCRQNLSAGTYAVCGALPPLAYGDGFFDLVYALSVFTHLNEDFQSAWLRELRRVLQPGGLAFITVHGQAHWQNLDAESQAELARRGFLFEETTAQRRIFPAWYQTAFHTPEYIRGRFEELFESVTHTPSGLGDLDVVAGVRPG